MKVRNSNNNVGYFFIWKGLKKIKVNIYRLKYEDKKKD